MHESQKQQSKPVPQAPDVKSSMPMPPGSDFEPENEVKTKTDKIFAEAEAPELSTSLIKRNATYKTVEKTGENCRIVRPLKDIEAELEWAPKKWATIRQCTNDVEKIAKNTGWSTEKIARVKNHIFHEAHILRDGKMRFNPDPEIASAWDRLYRGDFIKNDIQLLKHEYFESTFEALYKTNYDTAHNAAQHPVTGKPWQVQQFKD